MRTIHELQERLESLRAADLDPATETILEILEETLEHIYQQQIINQKD